MADHGAPFLDVPGNTIQDQEVYQEIILLQHVFKDR